MMDFKTIDLPVIDRVMIGIVFGCVAIGVVMYIFFQFPMIVPIWIVADIGIASLGITSLMYYMWRRRNKLLPMIKVFEKCILNNLNCLKIIEIGSNNVDWAPGEKKRPDDILYETSWSGVQIDPSLTTQSAEPERAPGGLDFYNYTYFDWVPQTQRNHNAYHAIIQYKKTRCKELDFLTDIEFISLISTPIHHLQHDINNYLDTYFQKAELPSYIPKTDESGNIVLDENKQPVLIPEIDPRTANPVMKTKYYIDYRGEDGEWYREERSTSETILLVENAKRVIWNELAPSIGFTAGNEAFKYNAFAHAAQDFDQAMKMIETTLREEFARKIDFALIGMLIIGMIVAGGVAVYVASMAFGK